MVSLRLGKKHNRQFWYCKDNALFGEDCLHATTKEVPITRRLPGADVQVLNREFGVEAVAKAHSSEHPCFSTKFSQLVARVKVGSFLSSMPLGLRP